MFDRSISLAMRIARDRYVEFAALAVVGTARRCGRRARPLLVIEYPGFGRSECGSRPEPGNAHATAQSTSGDRTRTSPAARVRSVYRPRGRRVNRPVTA